MRTFEEILADGNHAASVDNAEDILRCAEELEVLNTTEATAAALMYRGLGLFRRSVYPQALEHYRRSLSLYEEMGNRASVASVKQFIGDVYLYTGNYPFALEHYHQSLDLHKELGNRTGVAFVTNGIGGVYMSTGNYPLALEYFHQTLAIHEELGNRKGIATVKSNIGIMYGLTDNYPLALEHFHQALALHEEHGNRDGVATVTGNIGIVYLDTGNYPLALELFHRAQAIHEELGNREGAALVTGNTGNVYLGMGNYPLALEHIHRALALYEELGNRAGVARQTGNAGVAFVEADQYAEAKAMLNVMESMQIDDPGIMNKREQLRAAIQEHSGEFGAAVATLRTALELANQNALASNQADIHKQLRDLCRKMNDFEGYIEHNNEYTRITEEINGKDTATKMAMQEKQREIDAREREHAQHMAVLHSTLPKHIADRVARGETVNDHHENAAVIFLDIVGFTSISDRIPSGHVVHLLEQIFTTLDTVCKRNDVVKIKTIGDSYMAVSFESVANAATCALDMIASLDALEITMPPSLGDTSWTKDVGDIKVRVGIHCGPITAGVIGTARMQYDVWGDTVNVASRMESAGEPGRIHVSQAFAENLKSNQESRINNPISESHEVPLVTRHSSLVTTSTSLVTIERGSFDIKGKGMMNTYWLESLA